MGQAPPWPLAGQSSGQRSARSSATLNDILSSAGLADTTAVQTLLVAWDEIFSRFEPNLVVADFAPLAALAARGRIPLLQVGNGYTLPPEEMSRFPPLHRHAPPQWNEEATLSAVNEAAIRVGRPTLERLPQLFSGDRRVVQTFPLLDPYDTQRMTPVDGPLMEFDPIGRSAGAAVIFVYLSEGYKLPENLSGALAKVAGNVRIFAPALESGQLSELARHGAQIEGAAIPLRNVLALARLVVHSGGSGVSSEALAAGVPQLILSSQIEQSLNGEALQRAGVGHLVNAYDLSNPMPSHLIAALSENEALASRAAEAGQWHRKYLSEKNVALECECISLALLEK